MANPSFALQASIRATATAIGHQSLKRKRRTIGGLADANVIQLKVGVVQRGAGEANKKASSGSRRRRGVLRHDLISPGRTG
jgi:hypothetical protein